MATHRYQELPPGQPEVHHTRGALPEEGEYYNKTEQNRTLNQAYLAEM